MRLFYWVREYSESEEFPEVHIFASEAEARATMVSEALEVATLLGGWVTEEMDGPAVTETLKAGTHSARTVSSLNVERDGGSVDCFRLKEQDVPL